MTFDTGMVYSDCAGPCQRPTRLRKVWFSWFGHTFPLTLCWRCQWALVRDLIVGKARRG